MQLKYIAKVLALPEPLKIKRTKDEETDYISEQSNDLIAQPSDFVSHTSKQSSQSQEQEQTLFSVRLFYQS